MIKEIDQSYMQIIVLPFQLVICACHTKACEFCYTKYSCKLGNQTLFLPEKEPYRALA